MNQETEEIREYVSTHLLSAWLSHTTKTEDDKMKGGTIVDFLCRNLSMEKAMQPNSLPEKVVLSWIQNRETPEELITEALKMDHLFDSDLLPGIPDCKKIVDEGYYPCLCFVWYHVIKHTHSIKPDMVNEYLPSLPGFVTLLEKIVDNICEVNSLLKDDQDPDSDRRLELEMVANDWQASLTALIRCFEFFDEICDPYSRKAVQQFPITMITKVCEINLNSLAADLFEVAKLIRKSENISETGLVKEWAETVRENAGKTVRNDEEGEESDESMDVDDSQAIQAQKVKENQIKMQIIRLQDEKEKAIEGENFSEAQILTNQIQQYEVLLRNTAETKQKRKNVKSPGQAPVDGKEGLEETEGNAGHTIETLSKSLILVTELLKRQKKSFEAGLEHFFESLLLPVLAKLGNNFFSWNTEQRAIECLGLFGSLSQDIAKENYAMIMNLAKNEQKDLQGKPVFRAELQQLAIISLCDFCLFHPALLEGVEESTVSASTLVDNTDVTDQSQGLDSQASQVASQDSNLTKVVASLLLDLSRKLEIRSFPFADLNDERNQGMQYNITDCMMRILISGNYADALMTQTILNILQCPKKSKYKNGYDIISKVKWACIDGL